MLASLAAAFGSVALIFLTLGSFGAVLAIAVAAFGLAGMHYVVWGWWLGRLIQREVDEEERTPSAK